jgi:phage regulator Rha-like protein
MYTKRESWHELFADLPENFPEANQIRELEKRLTRDLEELKQLKAATAPHKRQQILRDKIYAVKRRITELRTSTWQK